MSWSNLGQSDRQPEPSESGPPERLVLDLEAGLETFLVVAGAIVGFLSLGLAFSFDEFSSARSWLCWVGGTAGLAAGCFLLRWGVDEYYILDFKKRGLLFHRKVFGRAAIHPVAPFSDFTAVAVQPTFHSSKHGSWWQYATVLVSRQGRLLRVTDSVREDAGWQRSRDTAETLADYLEIPFHPPEQERELVVERDRFGQVQLQYRERKLFSSAGLVVIIVFGGVLIAVVVALAAAN